MSTTQNAADGAVQEPDVETSDDGEDESAAPVELSKDDIFHLLQNQRRRDALRYLKGEEGKVRMRDLAEQVAAWEHDTTLEALTSNERQRVYIALYQSHLPKLDEEGIINYNQSRGIVERTDIANQLDPYLDHDGSEDEATEAGTDAARAIARYGPYFGGVLGLSTLLLGGAALNLPVTAILTVTVIGVLALTAFTNLTFDHVNDVDAQ